MQRLTEASMQSLQQSLRKLLELHTNGVITETEYESRRNQLVDNYVGQSPTSTATATKVPKSGTGRGAAGRGGTPMGRAGPAGRGAFSAAPVGWGLSGGKGARAAGAPPAKGGKSKGKGSPKNTKGATGAAVPVMGDYAPNGGYAGGLPSYSRNAKQDNKTSSRVGSSTVKVQPIPVGITQGTLAKTFEVFGEVSSAVVKHGSPTYGYVNFTSQQTAQAAVNRGQVEIAGTWSQVTLGKKQRKSLSVEVGPSNGIGLFNLPLSTTHDELHYMLKEYEGFQSVKMVQRKDTNQFKGYAFAYFNTVEDAVAAKIRLVGLTIGDQQVDVKFASQAQARTEDGAEAK